MDKDTAKSTLEKINAEYPELITKLRKKPAMANQTIRMPVTMLDKAKFLAKKQQTTLAKILRNAVERGLNEREVTVEKIQT